MRPVKLTISGNFWDSQIYAGEVILFDMDGAIHNINWAHIVDGIAERNKDIQTAIRVSFSDSDLFYNPKVVKILRDPHIESPIKIQLAKLSELELSIHQKDWPQIWEVSETPFQFLPTDTEIYYNQLFAGGNEGLFSVPKHSTHKYSSRKPATRHHDASIFQVKASDRFTAIATAAGNDGLFDFTFSKSDEEKLTRGRRVSEIACNACDWAFQSIMGWSSESAFLASFKEEKLPNSRKMLRTPDRIIDYKEIFTANVDTPNSVIWGSRDKIYKLSDDGIEVQRYHSNTKKNPNSTFTHLGNVEAKFDSSQVVATGTASFGTVIELDDKLLVLRSDGITEVFHTPPAHWRIFPRSEHYSNQLHIIYDDRIEIISFIHDYFVDQSTKLSGFAKGRNEYFEAELF